MSILWSLFDKIGLGKQKQIEETETIPIANPLIMEFFKEDESIKDNNDPLKSEMIKQNLRLKFPDVVINDIIGFTKECT